MQSPVFGKPGSQDCVFNFEFERGTCTENGENVEKVMIKTEYLAEEAIPFPEALISSSRAIGYNLQTAMSDIMEQQYLSWGERN